MATRKIIYRGWITETAEDPSALLFISLQSPLAVGLTTDHLALSPEEQERLAKLEQAVRAALLHLTDSEREVIERFYFHAEDYREISRRLHRATTHLVALHDRALRRLQKELRPFARECCGIVLERPASCVLCTSAHHVQIDQILAARDHARPWTPVMRRLKDELGVIIKNPSILIGHEKYH